MKNIFFLLMSLCLFSCENLQQIRAKKNLHNNPNWESQDFWGAFGGISSKPVRGIFFSISNYSKEITLTMPLPLPADSVLSIQFDEKPPQKINMLSETSADVSELANLFFSSQQAVLRGDLFNIGLEESVTIPLNNVRNAVQDMLVLSKSSKSVDEWLTDMRIEISEENYPQNNWFWTRKNLCFELDSKSSGWFRSTAHLLQDLYFLDFVGLCNHFLWENNAALFVRVERISQKLQFKADLIFTDVHDAGTIKSEKNKILPVRMRLDKEILQKNLIQTDQEGQVFDITDLLPYLQNFSEITIRWPNAAGEPLTTYAYLKGLNYRLMQIRTAQYLMREKF